MAMKIGNHYRWWDVAARDWNALASEIGMSQESMLSILRDLGMRMPDLASTCAHDAKAAGLDHTIFDRLVDSIAQSAARCLRLIGTGTTSARKR